MLKHYRQTSKSSRESFGSRISFADSTFSQDGKSLENMAYHEDESSPTSVIKESAAQRPKSCLSQTTNSTQSKSQLLRIQQLESILEEPASKDRGIKRLLWRISIFIVLVVAVIGISIATGYYYVRYYPEEKLMNSGDKRLIDYSSYFCSSVTTDSHDVWLTVVSALDYPKLIRYTMTSYIYLEVGRMWSRMFHLNKNSVIKIGMTSGDIVYVLVFKGKGNYDLWVERKTTTSYMMKQSCCVNGRALTDTFEFQSHENEDYYLVFYREDSFGIGVSFNTSLSFIRPDIDSTKIRDRCKALVGRKCTVGLELGSSERIIVEMHRQWRKGVVSKEEKISWKCNARIWFYCVVFGLSIILAAILIVMLYIFIDKYLHSRTKKVSKPAAVNSNHRTESISNGSNVQQNASNVILRSGNANRKFHGYTNTSLDKSDNWAIDDISQSGSAKCTVDEDGNKNGQHRNERDGIENAAVIHRNEYEKYHLAKYLTRNLRLETNDDHEFKMQRIRSSRETNNVKKEDSCKIVLKLPEGRKYTTEIGLRGEHVDNTGKFQKEEGSSGEQYNQFLDNKLDKETPECGNSGSCERKNSRSFKEGSTESSYSDRRQRDSIENVSIKNDTKHREGNQVQSFTFNLRDSLKKENMIVGEPVHI